MKLHWTFVVQYGLTVEIGLASNHRNAYLCPASLPCLCLSSAEKIQCALSHPAVCFSKLKGISELKCVSVSLLSCIWVCLFPFVYVCSEFVCVGGTHLGVCVVERARRGGWERERERERTPVCCFVTLLFPLETRCLTELEPEAEACCLESSRLAQTTQQDPAPPSKDCLPNSLFLKKTNKQGLQNWLSG